MSAASASVPAPTADELLVVVGPTATGKSALALELALRLGGELIGADSVQIYRRFDLGSGKPSAAERAAVPHHLVDCVDPLDHLDAARFVTLADAAVAEVRGRGKVPIVCGGSFLWVKALLDGLAGAPGADEELRARHREVAQREGRAALHAQLAAVDPESAARLAPNDFVRVSRALETFQLSGRTQAAWHAEHQFRDGRHRARLLGVRRDVPELDVRIRARVRAWLDAGWVAEVEGLVADGYREARAMGSVGYRQILALLDGRLPLDSLEDEIVRATRRFARRQRTWLRDEPRLSWLDP